MAHPRRVIIKKPRSRFWAAVTGAAVGSALTWWLDPETGRRRRASMRDKAAEALRRAEDVLGRTSRNLAERARGSVIDALRPESRDVSDEGLASRVRAELDRVSANADAIAVSCSEGVVLLEGPILKSELNRILRSIARVTGVRAIHDKLHAHRRADGVPGLERLRRRRHTRVDDRKPVVVRRLAGATGLALATYGLIRRKPLSVGAGLAGLALFARRNSNGHAPSVTRFEPIILADDPEGISYEAGDGVPDHSIH